jgi:hypothetical protein
VVVPEIAPGVVFGIVVYVLVGVKDAVLKVTIVFLCLNAVIGDIGLGDVGLGDDERRETNDRCREGSGVWRAR